MDETLKLDIRNMVADYENDRITDHELIEFLKEITAEVTMDVKEETRWCDLCEQYSHYSKDTPWGTCLCS